MAKKDNENFFTDVMNRFFGGPTDGTSGKRWQYEGMQPVAGDDEWSQLMNIGGGQPTYTFDWRTTGQDYDPFGANYDQENMVDNVMTAATLPTAPPAAPPAAPSAQYQEYLANEPFDIAEMNQRAGYTDGEKLAALLGLSGAALGYTGYKATRPDVPRDRLTKIGALDLRPVGQQGMLNLVGGSSGMPNASAAAGPLPMESSPARNPRQMDIFDQNVPPQQPKQERVAFKDRPRGGGFQPGDGGYKPPEGRGFKPKVGGGTLGTLLSIPLFGASVKAYADEGYTQDAALKQTLMDFGLGMLNLDSSSLGDSDIPYSPEEGMFQGFSFVPYR